MKIRRFTAPDMRQAINRVREELGPEAVILSNRKLDGEVEIIAAIDYDESFLEPSQESPAAGSPATEPSTREAPAASETRDVSLRRERASNGEEHTPADPPWAARERPATASRRPSAAVSYLAELSARVAEGAPRPVPSPRDESAVEEAPAVAEAVSDLAALREDVQLLRELMESQMMGLHQGREGPRTPSVARIAKRLTELGLPGEWVERLLDRLPRQGPLERLWSQALRQLAQAIPTRAPDFLAAGGVVVLVGPSGVGKTTTLAKIAARHILHHQRDGVVLVSCDDHRVGAHEQLRAYGQILGVPVYSTRARDELARIVARLKDERLVLVDTAGTNPLAAETRPPFPGLEGVAAEILLTLAAPVHPQVQAEYIRRYRPLGITGAILSKCDEAWRLGPALGAVMDAGLPLTLITDGPAIPDDLHPADPRELVNRSIDKVRRHRPPGTNPAKQTPKTYEGVASDDNS